MDIKGRIIAELVKNGYAESNGNRIWNLANRSFLQLTPEMSQAFLDLIKYKPYRENVFNVEVRLFRENLQDFIKHINQEQQFNLIDIGCGDGSKAKELIRALKGKPKIRYCPVSADTYMINIAIANVNQGGFENIAEFLPQVLDYGNLGEISRIIRTKEFRKNVILLHGSILASYEINDYLFNLKNSMSSEDYIIIGNSIRKGERLVGLEKYKDPVFRNWFMHLLKNLGFGEDEVEYDARFNEMRIEGFFKLKKSKKIKYDGKEIEFRKGDEILVAVLYKYYLEELEKFFKMYFSSVKIVKDPEDEYMIALCKK